MRRVDGEQIDDSAREQEGVGGRADCGNLGMQLTAGQPRYRQPGWNETTPLAPHYPYITPIFPVQF